MASNSKKIRLKSSDGKIFEVEEAVAIQSETIKNMIEDDCAENVIPIPNVTGEILSKVVQYCRKHVGDKEKKSEEKLAEIEAWDNDLAKELKHDQCTLYGLIMAANFLNVKDLLDLTCQTVADMIKGKMPEEIRKTFNIKNDFDPGEEEALKNENAWAFT